MIVPAQDPLAGEMCRGFWVHRLEASIKSGDSNLCRQDPAAQSRQTLRCPTDHPYSAARGLHAPSTNRTEFCSQGEDGLGACSGVLSEDG